MKKKYLAWMTDINTMLKVYKLAKERGKVAGDDIQQEFFEVMEQTDSHMKLLGKAEKTNMDNLIDTIKKSVKKRKNK